LLMMQNNFIAASKNVENLDPEAGDANVVTERKDNVTLNRVMSNSFGFGGTNATLVMQRYQS
ncbi:MAG: beta-ketoacyl-ACP synthase I, partial [Saccharospirillum sp.]